MSQDAVCQDAVCQETVRQDTVRQDTVRQAADQDAVPQDAAPRPAGDRVPAVVGDRGPAGRVGALVVAAWRDLLGLVVPVACAGCGQPDVPWCATCDAWLRGPASRRDHDAGRLDLLEGRTLLPVRAPASYAGPVRHAVAAWKDGGRADLDAPFRTAARRTGTVTAADVRRVLGPGAPPDGAVPVLVVPVLVVPVPSTAGAQRRRGRAPVEVLASAVAAGLRDGGVPARRSRALLRTGGADLAGLGARARGVALAGRVRVRRGTAVRDRAVVLVDDVLTTGATLAACHGALVGAGAHVLGACALAATAPPGAGRADGPARSVAPVVHGRREAG